MIYGLHISSNKYCSFPIYKSLYFISDLFYVEILVLLIFCYEKDLSLFALVDMVSICLRRLLINFMIGSESSITHVACNQQCIKVNILKVFIGVNLSSVKVSNNLWIEGSMMTR